MEKFKTVDQATKPPSTESSSQQLSREYFAQIHLLSTHPYTNTYSVKLPNLTVSSDGAGQAKESEVNDYASALSYNEGNQPSASTSKQNSYSDGCATNAYIDCGEWGPTSNFYVAHGAVIYDAAPNQYYDGSDDGRNSHNPSTSKTNSYSDGCATNAYIGCSGWGPTSDSYLTHEAVIYDAIPNQNYDGSDLQQQSK